MIDIRLNYEDAILLHEILDEYISDLRMEISDTHDSKYKGELKNKEVFLKKIVSELTEVSAQEPVI